MKLDHYWVLLKYEAGFLLFAAGFPIFMGWNMSRMSEFGVGAFMLVLMIAWGYTYVFQKGSFGFRQGNAAFVRPLEFSFTRAVCRKTLYAAKITLFSGFVLIYPVYLYFYSLQHPARTLNFCGAEQNDASFYLSHFPGAFIQESGKLLVIVLPHGNIETGLFLLLATVPLAAAYQALLLGTLRFRWCQCLIPIGMFLASIAFPFSQLIRTGNRPPLFDQALGWTVLHPLLFVCLVAAVVVPALRFGCARFAAQEVSE